MDPKAIKFPNGKLCCFAHTRELCTLGKKCPCSRATPSPAMLKKRNEYEQKNGNLYEGWAEKVHALAGGKSAGKGDGKPVRDTSHLQTDEAGNVLPLSKVGCNFKVEGKECPNGDNCKFSHKPADIKARKKFLAERDKKNGLAASPAPKASAKAKAKAKAAKEKEGEEVAVGFAALSEQEDSEDAEDEDEEISERSDDYEP